MENNTQDVFNMGDLESFFLNSSIDINIGNFIVAILLSLILAYLIKFTYIKVSTSLNDKEHFSETFVPLAIITTLVITVIKFSLALSLGLVGALSIVRFRAAIKEPEELVYLFFSIAIGIGFGAGQTLITSVIFILIAITIYLFSSKKNISNTIDYNLLIEIPYKESQLPEQAFVLKNIKTHFSNYSISKIEIDDGVRLLIVLEVSSNEIENISKFEESIKLKYNNSKISYFENRVIT